MKLIATARQAARPSGVVVFAALGQAAGGFLVLGWAYARSDWLRQDEKDQLGLDQFECRRYVAVQRHLILTAISHLLLARLRLMLIAEGREAGGKNLTVQQVRRAVDTSIEAASLKPEARRKRLRRTAELIDRVPARNAKARRCHYRRRIKHLHALGIDIETCRCCIPPEQKPALSC